MNTAYYTQPLIFPANHPQSLSLISTFSELTFFSTEPSEEEASKQSNMEPRCSGRRNESHSVSWNPRRVDERDELGKGGFRKGGEGG